MPLEPRYKRVLVKLSGESLCSPGGFGIEEGAVWSVVEEILPLREMGVEVALVIGGGNFIRGKDFAPDSAVQRTTADYMGMLATVINALALQDVLESRGVPSRVLGAISMAEVCEPFTRRRAIDYLRKGRVIILAGGTGRPFFTTDTCAALRAGEIGAEVLLKATKVDGVFDSDPAENPSAKRYASLTYQQVLADRLGIMDLPAIAMCMDNRIPVIVFALAKSGNLAAVVSGEDIGTRISD